MKVAIVNNGEENSVRVAKRLMELLLDEKIKIDENTPEFVISVGGDGTLLKAFHNYQHRLSEVKFLGVHTGHLGFYTDWRDFELEELVASLKENRANSVSYPILDVQIGFRDGTKSKHYLALNESTIRRGSRTLVGDVLISDELFERFRGDGLSISTPTGSTAYNKSVGGAVIHPSIKAIQLAEIASLNNRVFRTLGSPIVIGQNEWVKVALQESDDYAVMIDQLEIKAENISSVCYRIASEEIHFASYRHTHFWNRVKDAFIGDGE
ncbi:MAG: NAD kinase [Lactobacillales bacterium]|jgi:NAD+ kinase|nr:NAD kinase [Lactobacillales bacterium]